MAKFVQCGVCIFWKKKAKCRTCESLKEDRAECCRRSPSPSFENPEMVGAAWPHTFRFEGCGEGEIEDEFQPRLLRGRTSREGKKSA